MYGAGPEGSATCFFFDKLPRELRDQVYCAVYGHRTYEISTLCWFDGLVDAAWVLNDRDDYYGLYKLGYLAVNKQWFTEATSTLIGGSTITIPRACPLQRIIQTSSSLRNNLKSVALLGIDVWDLAAIKYRAVARIPHLTNLSLVLDSRGLVGLEDELPNEVSKRLRRIGNLFKRLRGLRTFKMVWDPDDLVSDELKARSDLVAEDVTQYVTLAREKEVAK